MACPACGRDHVAEMHSRKRVLIVDAYVETGRLEAILARGCGYGVDIVESGPEALTFLRGNVYDAVLLGSPIAVDDHQILLDVLVSELQHHARRTIVLTTHTRDATVLTRARDAEVFAVVAKPFDVEIVTLLIRECVENSGRGGAVRWVGIDPATVPAEAASCPT